jgi:hypothetical protein
MVMLAVKRVLGVLHAMVSLDWGPHSQIDSNTGGLKFAGALGLAAPVVVRATLTRHAT